MKSSSNQQTNENNELDESANNSDNANSNASQTLELNENIYSAVIDEYKNAILDSKNNTNYKYVNSTAIHYYLVNKGFDFTYSFLDVNKDGIYEMLISDSEISSILGIFSYDGNNIITLFEDDKDCLGDRCRIRLYDDGTINLEGSSGADNQYESFYNINKNVSTFNTINSYYLKYDENGNLTIYDEKTYDFLNDTGVKLNYSSSEELFNLNIHNANSIDLNSINWIKIN